MQQGEEKGEEEGQGRGTRTREKEEGEGEEKVEGGLETVRVQVQILYIRCGGDNGPNRSKT
jgi:hypothetical protein